MSLKDMPKLNLGCGNIHKDGFVNIDKVDPCDVRIDLESGILPYGDGTVGEIEADNFFVMISNLRWALNECWRVLASRGTLSMLNFDAGKHPYLYFQDPEHKRGFTNMTHLYFIAGTDQYKDFGRKYGYAPWKLGGTQEVGACLRTTLIKE